MIWKANLGVNWEGFLKIEFKGGKMHISKLAYKCMKHETNWYKKRVLFGEDLLKCTI